MANARAAWGIDIGNRALKAVKLVRDGDRLRIDDLEVLEHEQILSSAGDNREMLVQNALAGFVQRHPTKGSIAGISVSGQSSFARFIKLPPVEAKKIPEIVKFEAIQQIPFSLDEVEWSYQLFQDPESPDIEVGLFAMRKELVNAQIKQFTDLDINVQVVQTSPLAVYNAMQYDGQFVPDGATMIVDCGAENTDLIIAEGEQVWLRTISIGGNNFTEALTKAFKLNFPKAEDLKRNAATSKYQRQIFQAMRPVFADFVSEIQRSLGFYGTVHRDSKIKRIIALGSTFRLPTLQKYLQQNLQIEVKRLDGYSGGAPSDGRLASMLTENAGSLGTAYGLAVQALGDAKINSSLLPEQIRKAKLWKEKTPWFGLAAACFVLGTVGGPAARWYIDRQKFDSQSVNRGRVDQIINTGQTMESAYASLQDQGKADRDRIQYVDGMLTNRTYWRAIYQDLTQLKKSIPSLADQTKEQLEKTKRSAREQIVLHAMSSAYRAKMTDILGMTDEQFKALTIGPNGEVTGLPMATGVAGVEGAQPNPAAAAAQPIPAGLENARGFLLTLRCTTPNAAGSSFVQQTLVNNLLTSYGLDKVAPPAPAAGATGAAAAATPTAWTQPYAVAKATIVASTKLATDTSLQQLMHNAANGQMYGTGMGGGMSVGPEGGEMPFNVGQPVFRPRMPFTPPAAFRPGVPGAPALDPTTGKPLVAFPDPLTGEDMADDTSVTVLVAIVLNPAPIPPNAGPTNNESVTMPTPAAPAPAAPDQPAPAAPAPVAAPAQAPVVSTPAPAPVRPVAPPPAPPPVRPSAPAPAGPGPRPGH